MFVNILDLAFVRVDGRDPETNQVSVTISGAFGDLTRDASSFSYQPKVAPEIPPVDECVAAPGIVSTHQQPLPNVSQSYQVA